MTLRLNGETVSVEPAPATLGDLLAALGYEQKRLAVEHNQRLVPRARWRETGVAEGDQLEVVQFVGGG